MASSSEGSALSPIRRTKKTDLPECTSFIDTDTDTSGRFWSDPDDMRVSGLVDAGREARWLTGGNKRPVTGASLVCVKYQLTTESRSPKPVNLIVPERSKLEAGLPPSPRNMDRGWIGLTTAQLLT